MKDRDPKKVIATRPRWRLGMLDSSVRVVGESMAFFSWPILAVVVPLVRTQVQDSLMVDKRRTQVVFGSCYDWLAALAASLEMTFEYLRGNTSAACT